MDMSVDYDRSNNLHRVRNVIVAFVATLVAAIVSGFFLWGYFGYGTIIIISSVLFMVFMLAKKPMRLVSKWNIWICLLCITVISNGVLSRFTVEGIPLVNGSLGGSISSLIAGGYYGVSYFWIIIFSIALLLFISPEHSVIIIKRILFSLARVIIKISAKQMRFLVSIVFKTRNRGLSEQEIDSDPSSSKNLESQPTFSRDATYSSKMNDSNHIDSDRLEAGELSSSAQMRMDVGVNSNDKWNLPNLSILEKRTEEIVSDTENSKKAELIEKTLADHRVEVKVQEIRPGPTVTLFGLVPGWFQKRKKNVSVDKSLSDVTVSTRSVTGNDENERIRVKVDSILAREKDIALALATQNVRFEAPVAGESYIGLEIPNHKPALVSLRDIMEAKSFKLLQSKSLLPVALGRGSGGEAMAIDLTDMPHILIAGSTGAGKSVCINALLCCLLLQMSPKDLRLLLIDPKRVELAPYNHLPHLLSPVIVDPEKAANLLNGLIREMQRRYKLLEGKGARNILGYNKKLTESDEKMPYIVTVIDELADLMLASSLGVEHALTRLAQLGRATGIHLVVATQRPSVDVVTGLIKANFPSRLSFAVASQVDSRTILDMTGAEKLVGKGDMLFMPSDYPKPKRLQGVFIDEKEVEDVVDFWKDFNGPLPSNFKIDETPEIEKPADDLLGQARDMAIKQGHISVSLLQRRLSIGYMKAARLVDQLEAEGLLGVGEPGKSRPVIMDTKDTEE